MKKQNGGVSILMTEQQTQWLTIQRLMANTKPRVKYAVPASRFRRAVFRLVESSKFDAFMIAVILMNILVMMMEHQGQDQAWENSLEAANGERLGWCWTGGFVQEALRGEGG